MVAPGASTHLASASSIIDNAILSLTLPPGLNDSTLTAILAFCPSRPLISTRGVRPISSVMFLCIIMLKINGFNCQVPCRYPLRLFRTSGHKKRPASTDWQAELLQRQIPQLCISSFTPVSRCETTTATVIGIKSHFLPLFPQILKLVFKIPNGLKKIQLSLIAHRKGRRNSCGNGEKTLLLRKFKNTSS